MEQIAKQAEDRVTVLGIDPGRETGLYCASIPRSGPDRALTLGEFLKDGRWLGNAKIALSDRKTAPVTERWAEMQKRIEYLLYQTEPRLIVLEYPADGMPGWSASRGQSARGTDFKLGMFFGFAAIASERYGEEIGQQSKIALMPVTSSKAAGRVGWMPKVTTQKGNRKVTHTQDRETTLRQCREIAGRLWRNAGTHTAEVLLDLSDHELMALGVLTYYVTNRRPSEWGR